VPVKRAELLRTQQTRPTVYEKKTQYKTTMTKPGKKWWHFLIQK
jgi:hypothetical protein